MEDVTSLAHKRPLFYIDGMTTKAGFQSGTISSSDAESEPWVVPSPPKLFRPLIIGTIWSLSMLLIVGSMNLYFTLAGDPPPPEVLPYWFFTPPIAVMLMAAVMAAFSAERTRRRRVICGGFIILNLGIQFLSLGNFVDTGKTSLSILSAIAMLWLPAGAYCFAFAVVWLKGVSLIPPNPTAETKITVRSLLAVTTVGALLCGIGRMFASNVEHGGLLLLTGFIGGVMLGAFAFFSMMVQLAGRGWYRIVVVMLLLGFEAAPFLLGGFLDFVEIHHAIFLSVAVFLLAIQITIIVAMINLEGFTLERVAVQEAED